MTPADEVIVVVPHPEHWRCVTANSDVVLTRNCMAARTPPSGTLSFAAMQPGQNRPDQRESHRGRSTIGQRFSVEE
jgi:hypothetical protein